MLWLAVAVPPLCSGPAFYLNHRGMAPAVARALGYAALPARVILEATGLGGWIDEWAVLWQSLAERHAASD